MTRDIRRAFDFARDEARRQFGDQWAVALFVVQCCSVYDISKLSRYPEEEELVLPPNADLEVVNFLENTESFEVLPSPSSLS